MSEFLPGEDPDELTDDDTADHRRHPRFDRDAEARHVHRGAVRRQARAARGRPGEPRHHRAASPAAPSKKPSGGVMSRARGSAGLLHRQARRQPARGGRRRARHGRDHVRRARRAVGSAARPAREPRRGARRPRRHLPAQVDRLRGRRSSASSRPAPPTCRSIPDAPAARSAYILHNCAVKVVVVEAALAEQARAPSSRRSAPRPRCSRSTAGRTPARACARRSTRPIARARRAAGRHRRPASPPTSPTSSTRRARRASPRA